MVTRHRRSHLRSFHTLAMLCRSRTSFLRCVSTVTNANKENTLFISTVPPERQFFIHPKLCTNQRQQSPKPALSLEACSGQLHQSLSSGSTGQTASQCTSSFGKSPQRAWTHSETRDSTSSDRSSGPAYVKGQLFRKSQGSPRTTAVSSPANVTMGEGERWEAAKSNNKGFYAFSQF